MNNFYAGGIREPFTPQLSFERGFAKSFVMAALALAVDAEEKDVEDERGAAGNDVADSGLPVGHVRRNDERP